MVWTGYHCTYIPGEQFEYKGWRDIKFCCTHKVESVAFDVEKMNAISTVLGRERERGGGGGEGGGGKGGGGRGGAGGVREGEKGGKKVRRMEIQVLKKCQQRYKTCYCFFLQSRRKRRREGIRK